MTMNGTFLLDTNIVVALFRGDVSVRDKLIADESVHVPVVVVAELWYGAIGSRQSEENLDRLHRFIDRSSVVSINALTARHYAEIKMHLRLAGTPIPENDLWIAAIARQYALVLVSRDIHFSMIPHLAAERW